VITLILNYRNSEIEFKVKSLYIKPEKITRNSTLDFLIFGADTESAQCNDENGKRYEPICSQLSGERLSPALRYFTPLAKGLQEFLEFFDDYAGLDIMNEERKHHACFIYFHNMKYDWGQLIKNYPTLIFMYNTETSPEEDYTIFDNGQFKAILKPHALFKGSAPFFTIVIWYNKEVNYEIKFRDTSSFFPASLDSLGKELQLEIFKEEHPENLGKIDFRKIPDTDPRKIEFEKYALADPLVTRLVAERIRELHIKNNMFKMRVSAPSFAMGILTGNEHEYKLRSGVNDESIMQLIVNSYCGGRTGGIFHGQVFNCFVLDLHSSYPASMCSLPSFSENMVYYEMTEMEIAELTEIDLFDLLNTYHCFMEISGEETDSKYPCLMYVEKQLYPVYGKFEHIATTGIEVFVGLKTGTLIISQIHRIIMLLDDEESYKPFREFATGAYERKATSGKGTPEYTAAKLVLNSSYGKLIEKLATQHIDDTNNLFVPYIKGMEQEFAQMYYSKYCEMLDTGESNFLKYANEMISDFMNDEDLQGKLEFGMLSNLGLSKQTFGQYAIPAAAALITATSRARLLVGMKLLKADYWDTDSLFFINGIDIDKANEILKQSAELLPAFIQPLTIGENLGELDVEIENAQGYLAGTKRYYLENPVRMKCPNKTQCKDCPRKKECELKSARHGMPATSKNNCGELIQKLATGQNATYTGKPKPLQIKEARTPERIGLFESKEYTSQFKLDERLNWKKVKGGWRGNVIPINEIVSRETC